MKFNVGDKVKLVWGPRRSTVIWYGTVHALENGHYDIEWTHTDEDLRLGRQYYHIVTRGWAAHQLDYAEDPFARWVRGVREDNAAEDHGNPI